VKAFFKEQLLVLMSQKVVRSAITTPNEVQVTSSNLPPPLM
jgi:hypothetical protein